ncbi:MAG TPA: hypothetical protein DCL66_06595 [Gammaproteobacteria bacterium]|nr:hypothetical protein [Gammaproteobacteria bacterium]|tara:strand:+ start:192 stop:518 length:327 start_codon:yes stop_codon:yes gene_type:complete
MQKLLPEVAAWYADAVSGMVFEVVAIDEESRTIEVQFIDGEVGEYDRPTWKSLLLSSIEPPEDWRSPFEVSAEDGLDSDNAIIPDDWSGPLSKFEPEMIDFGDDFQIL